MTSTQSTLRQSLLAARAAQPPALRWQKGVAAAQALARHRAFRSCKNIGLYLAVAAECPTLPLSLLAEAADKQLHYPRILSPRTGRMTFVRSHTDSQWRRNVFNIPEPLPARPQDIVHPKGLDIIVLPLVGFDLQGQRIGMGAGYYDRCLAFRRHRQHWRRPLLIGLAYDCQQTDRIPAQPWDVPLDAIATESGLTFFKH